MPHFKDFLSVKPLLFAPLISFIKQKGKCTHCNTRISARYPIVEFLTAVLSISIVAHFGLSLHSMSLVFFSWVLIALAFIDLEHQLLPDGLTLPLLWAGILLNLTNRFVPLEAAVIGAVSAYLALFGFTQLFYLVTGKVGMGEGDFKLFSAFGAWFGWQPLLHIIIYASFLGAICGIAWLYIQKKGKDTPIPFGPFLCIAVMIYIFVSLP